MSRECQGPAARSGERLPEMGNGMIWFDVQARSDPGRMRKEVGDGEEQHQNQYTTFPQWTLWYRWNHERKNGSISRSLYKKRDSDRVIRLEKIANVSCYSKWRYKGRPSPVAIVIHMLSHLNSQVCPFLITISTFQSHHSHQNHYWNGSRLI